MPSSQPAAGRRQNLLPGLLLSALSGSLLALSFPRFNLEFLAWFAFVPLFLALRNKSKRISFLLAFLCGVVFWSVTICWLVNVTFPGTIVLALYLALFFGLFGIFVPLSSGLSCPARALFIPSLWVLVEYLRSHLFTGFPWALLGYSQYLNLPAIQIADIFGAWGVSFAVMAVNSGIYQFAGLRRPAGFRQKLRVLSVPFAILALVFGYGYFKLFRSSAPADQAGRYVKISVIQGNIPQELKWYPEARGRIIEKYSDLSRLAARDRPDLIVWPEAALPVVLEEEPQYYGMVRGLAREIRTPLLFGAVTAVSEKFYNSAVLVSAEGEPVRRYNKLHLVPFGEYIPLRDALPFLQTIAPIGDVSPGREYSVFGLYKPGEAEYPALSKFSVLICFEDVFPEISRRFVNNGAQYLINITNDAWYKRTFASYQHCQASVFRAVENRVFVVRSANTGISGFISPEGCLVSAVADNSGNEIFVGGFKTASIPLRRPVHTVYTRAGDKLMMILCSLAAVFSWIALSAARKKRSRYV